MLLLGDATLWEQVKGTFVWILLRRYLIRLVILRSMLMSAPKKKKHHFFFLDHFFVSSFSGKRIFRIICYKFRFLGLSLAPLNSGSEVQSSALLTNPLENTGQSQVRKPFEPFTEIRGACLCLPPSCYRPKEGTRNYNASCNLVFTGTQ